jgi:lipase chaperone LimK
VRGAGSAAAAGALLAAVGLALALAGGRGAAPPAAPGAAPGAAAPAAASREEPPPRAGTPPREDLPASLRGTAVDGDLLLDPGGRFVPGPEALVLFDYFLAATGEEPEERIRSRIVAEIRRRLPPQAAAEAEALLERYLAYRAEAAALFAAESAPADPERRFQLVRELRRKVFGAGLAAALFGEEERVVALDVERRRIARDETLDAGERARRLEALEAQLPEAERSARREARAALELRAAEAALRAAGAGPAEIAAERERRFGPEAAARLAALDLRRAEWDARVAAYRAERDALRARGLEAEESAAALEALRDARFQGPERLRIEALDRIEAGGASR